ncbi:zinc finger, CCHC-type containing protein [Tanacetum coccineum]
MFRNPFLSTTIGDENPIRTLGDYSKPSHEGYRNTIELPVGNNVVPLRSDIIRLVQNGCSFYRLRSEDPNQHLKDFLKLMDSLDLDGSITTWEDLTTRFLTQFFSPRRTKKLQNDILMFQQHHGESLFESWTRFKDLLQKSLIMASTFGSKSKFSMTMSIPSQDEPLTNRPVETSWLLKIFLQSTISRGRSSEERRRNHNTEHGHNIIKEAKEEVKEVIDEEESEVETNEEVEEILEDEEEDEDGSFAYECDFMILEDTTSIIDRHLGEMAFGRPFIDETGLVYDREEGTIAIFPENGKFLATANHVPYPPPEENDNFPSTCAEIVIFDEKKLESS